MRLTMKKTLIAAAVTSLSVSFAIQAQARDYIAVVGSSTMFPFSTTVAENFGRKGTFKTPKIESTGTGGGIKLFCAGVGVDNPDIANASRRMKASEFDQCADKGVKEIVEVKIGFDGIAIARSKKAKGMDLSLKDLYLALAKDVPNPDGSPTLVANPNAVGIFGFSFLEQNQDKVQAATIDGVAPTFETISDGKYPVSRSLFFYVKKAHVGTIPGMAEFVTEFTSEAAWGPEGYLADKGLIPLPDQERKEVAKAARAMTPMTKP
jgi:ABC-type phosphate transport system substrate-binding protein